MSEHTFLLCPVDPEFVPTAEQVKAVTTLWQQISPCREGEWIFCEKAPVMWNFGEVQTLLCRSCGASLAIGLDDHLRPARDHEWWYGLQQMNFGAESRSEVNLPCCNDRAPLVELFGCCGPSPIYSRFVCGLHEPDFDPFETDLGPMLPEYVRKFESILGVGLQQLWRGD
jgi:hypothetical protein